MSQNFSKFLTKIVSLIDRDRLHNMQPTLSGHNVKLPCIRQAHSNSSLYKYGSLVHCTKHRFGKESDLQQICNGFGGLGLGQQSN